MKRSGATAVLLLALAFLTSCQARSPETPVGAYLTFHKALQQGNLPGAWKLLSSPTQKVLEERTRAIAATAGGGLELRPEAVAFANVPRPPDVTEVQIVREDGERAVVEVVAGTERKSVSLRNEGGTWKIDLEAQLVGEP